MNEPPAQPTPRRKRRWPWFVLLLLIVAYAAYRYSLHRMVEVRLDAIRKQGYPVTLEELNAWYKQAPAGENAADIYTNAFSRLDPWTGERSKSLPLVGSSALPPPGDALPEEMKRAIAAYLVDNREALNLFHKAAAIRHCRYPSDLSKWPPDRWFNAMRQTSARHAARPPGPRTD